MSGLEVFKQLLDRAGIPYEEKTVHPITVLTVKETEFWFTGGELYEVSNEIQAVEK